MSFIGFPIHIGPWTNISSFLSLSFPNKDLFLSSRAVDLPTLLLLYRSEFLCILLFTLSLWILFPPVLPLPLASRSCLFYSTRPTVVGRMTSERLVRDRFYIIGESLSLCWRAISAYVRGGFPNSIYAFPLCLALCPLFWALKPLS